MCSTLDLTVIKQRLGSLKINLSVLYIKKRDRIKIINNKIKCTYYEQQILIITRWLASIQKETITNVGLNLTNAMFSIFNGLHILGKDPERLQLKHYKTN